MDFGFKDHEFESRLGHIQSPFFSKNNWRDLDVEKD